MPKLGPLPPKPLLAVSGGADSVALLRLALLAGVEGVAVAHVQHGLRPEAETDAQFVQELCAQFKVPCTVLRGDAAALAKKRGRGTEEAARLMRYSLLSRYAGRLGAGGIVTAHTRSDQAETVLWRLLRGESPLGMQALSGRVWRPLLGVSGAALRGYLRLLSQSWREDASNADTQHTRAWLRAEVLPTLARRFPETEAMLARVAELTAQDEALLGARAAALSPDNLGGQPPALLRRRLAALLREAGTSAGTQTLSELAEALSEGRTAHHTLRAGREATVSGGRLHLPSAAPPAAPPFPAPAGLEWRSGRAGDFMRLGAGRRKVSDLLGEARVPRGERDGVLRLAVAGELSQEGGEVIWLHTAPDAPLLSLRAAEYGLSPPLPTQAMRWALELAKQAAQAGEVPIGAVVLRGDTVVGRGRNRSREQGDMTAHAELLALREAAYAVGPYLTDCTLYVTLEPCPMCYGAALEARLGALVYGAKNPKMGALGGVSDLREAHFGHKVAVRGGLLEREAARLLRDFFAGLR